MCAETPPSPPTPPQLPPHDDDDDDVDHVSDEDTPPSPPSDSTDDEADVEWSDDDFSDDDDDESAGLPAIVPIEWEPPPRPEPPELPPLDADIGDIIGYFDERETFQHLISRHRRYARQQRAQQSEVGGEQAEEESNGEDDDNDDIESPDLKHIQLLLQRIRSLYEEQLRDRLKVARTTTYSQHEEVIDRSFCIHNGLQVTIEHPQLRNVLQTHPLFPRSFFYLKESSLIRYDVPARKKVEVACLGSSGTNDSDNDNGDDDDGRRFRLRYFSISPSGRYLLFGGAYGSPFFVVEDWRLLEEKGKTEKRQQQQEEESEEEGENMMISTNPLTHVMICAGAGGLRESGCTNYGIFMRNREDHVFVSQQSDIFTRYKMTTTGGHIDDDDDTGDTVPSSTTAAGDDDDDDDEFRSFLFKVCIFGHPVIIPARGGRGQQQQEEKEEQQQQQQLPPHRRLTFHPICSDDIQSYPNCVCETNTTNSENTSHYYVATATDDYGYQLYSNSGTKFIYSSHRSLSFHQTITQCDYVEFSPDDRYFACAGGGTIRVFEVCSVDSLPFKLLFEHHGEGNLSLCKFHPTRPGIICWIETPYYRSGPAGGFFVADMTATATTTATAPGIIFSLPVPFQLTAFDFEATRGESVYLAMRKQPYVVQLNFASSFLSRCKLQKILWNLLRRNKFCDVVVECQFD